MNANRLLEDLTQKTKTIILEIESLKEKEFLYLTWRKEKNSWNILECLEHLNLYGDFYLPVFKRAISESKTKNEKDFNSGWLGNYFAKSMLPRETLNYMKTFKDKNPLHEKLDKRVIEKFLKQQKQLLKYLEDAEKVSLNKVKVPISIAKWIKLKLGDALHFFVNHNLRHIEQIKKIRVEIDK